MIKPRFLAEITASALVAIGLTALTNASAQNNAPVLFGTVERYKGSKDASVCLLGCYVPGKGYKALSAANATPFQNGLEMSAIDVRGIVRARAALSGVEPFDGNDPNPLPSGASLPADLPPEQRFLAVSGTVTAPRRPVTIRKPDAQDVRDVAAFLRTTALKNRIKTPRVTRVLSVDLNGDGREETLIGARSHDGDDTITYKSRFYSVVLLRFQNDAGRSQVVPLGATAVTESAYESDQNCHARTVAGITDFGGDGKTEIVLYLEDYEGMGLRVFGFTGAKSVKLFEYWGGV